MSLLRSVLKKSAPSSPDGGGAFDPGRMGKPKPSTSSAASFKSVASTIKSIASFYSVVTGNGPKVLKRRRPPLLTFGAPTFYHSDPPSAVLPEGVERVPIPHIGGTGTPFISGHASTLLENMTEGDPWLSIVVFSHARSTDSMPNYHDRASVTGQIRMRLTKPKTIDSIDVWLVGKMDCVLEMHGKPIVQQRARVFPNPSFPAKKKFNPGTYVFPFTFIPLEQEVHINQPEEAQRKNKGEVRLDLPPACSLSAVAGFSGEISYTVGANLTYSNIMAVNDSVDLKIAYTPRTRPLPRPLPPFPLLPTREDWPFQQEIIGGWMLMPFGGRGRFRDEMIEVEGILGVPYPPVYHARDEMPFKLILWSESTEALAAFTAPSQLVTSSAAAAQASKDDVRVLSSAEAYRLGVNSTARVQLASPSGPGIHVSFVENDTHGTDALVPRSASRRNRKTYVRGTGWLNIDHEDNPLISSKQSPEATPLGKVPNTKRSPAESATVSSRLTSITEDDYSSEEEEEDECPLSPVSPSSPSSEHPTAELSAMVIENSVHQESDAFDESTPAAPIDINEQSLGPASDKETAGGAESLSVSPPTSIEGDSDHETAVPPEGDIHDCPSFGGSFDNEEFDEGYFPGMEDAQNMVTLAGKVPLSGAAGRPSFNYKYMARQYMIKITITHPDYNHITPSAIGIYAEAPIWVTTDPVYSESTNYPTVPHKETAHLEEAAINNTIPPINGTVTPLATSERSGSELDSKSDSGSSKSIGEIKWFPSVMASHSEKPRPTWKAERLAAF